MVSPSGELLLHTVESPAFATSPPAAPAPQPYCLSLVYKAFGTTPVVFIVKLQKMKNADQTDEEKVIT